MVLLCLFLQGCALIKFTSYEPFVNAGNLCTCLVVARNAHLRNQTYIYLTNLAITDMLTLLVGKMNQNCTCWA